MIRLHNTTTALKVVLADAVTTNQLHCSACYYDVKPRIKLDNSEYQGARNRVRTNDTTEVTLVEAPTHGIVRNIDSISINNQDTVDAEVILKLDDGGTEDIILQVILGANESLLYEGDGGYQVL